jgi:tetratricopeptide (TPR) repeat protein
MNRILFLSSVLFILNVGIKAQEPLDSLMEIGAYSDVISFASKNIEKDSSDLLSKQYLAKAAFLGNRFTIAKKYALDLEKLGIDTVKHRQNLMRIYEAEQNYPLAVKYAQKLQLYYPVQGYYTRKMADYHLASGYPVEALNLYHQAYLIEPGDINNVTALAEHLNRNGQNSLADSIVNKALISEPQNLALHSMAVRIKMALKAYPNAISHLKFIENQGVLSPWQYKNAGYAYYMTDTLDKALHYLEQSLHNEQSPELNYYYLALVHTSLKNTEEAKKYFNRAIEAGISGHVKIYFHHLSAFDAREEKYADAMEKLDLSYALFGDPESLFYQGAYAESRYSNKQKAIQFYQKYLNECKELQCQQIEAAKERIKILKEYQFMKSKSK